MDDNNSFSNIIGVFIILVIKMKSKIEWTDATWNPITGCTKVSSGCKNCYAERMSKRLHAMGKNKYRNNFELTIHENELDMPYHWKKPRMIFVNSMSDLFHEKVSDEFILSVFQVMNENPDHTFQILTKRAKRLYEFSQNHPIIWSKNIWMGVSIENMEVIDRINYLIAIPAKMKFLSCEPLLSNLKFNQIQLMHLDWIIVGGESGPSSRPMKKEWVINIKNQCEFYSIPFFFKQWGGVNKYKNGKLLEGKEYLQMPIMRN